MSKYKTVALTIPSWNGKPALMTKGKGDKWYYGISPTHFTGIKVTILKDYGMVDIDNFGDVEIQFTKEFYMPETGIKNSPGWLSPNGIYYPCHSWGHDSLASTICKAILNFYPHTAHRELEDRQWIKVYDDMIAVYHLKNGPTQKQIDALFDLSQITKSERLKNQIMRVISNA